MVIKRYLSFSDGTYVQYPHCRLFTHSFTHSLFHRLTCRQSSFVSKQECTVGRNAGTGASPHYYCPHNVIIMHAKFPRTYISRAVFTIQHQLKFWACSLFSSLGLCLFSLPLLPSLLLSASLRAISRCSWLSRYRNGSFLDFI